MFAIMMDSWLNTEVFESSLQTLERSLGMPPDEMLPDLLSIYPLCPEHTRKIIDAFLSRAGLVDPTGALQREVISWAKHRGRSTSRAVLRRRVNHFLARWRESWECNARMVAEELRQERLQAQVRADMLRALARHEASVLHLDGEDITLQLADHPSEQLTSPTTIDVLNYFVEMSEPAPEGWQKKQKSRKQATKLYRNWRRQNKDLISPERGGPALRGHVPLSAGLHQPTTLVTHAEEGLSPLPWPTGTLQVRLRVAGKFYHRLGKGDEGDD